MRGRGTLRYNAGLALAGRRHAGDMVRRRYFSHDSRSGDHFDDRIRRTGYLRGARSALVGENLGWGTGFLATPRAMVRQWMNSPGHRANILRPGFKEIGIAVVTRTPGGTRGATYATAFGRRVRPAGTRAARRVRLGGREHARRRGAQAVEQLGDLVVAAAAAARARRPRSPR